jgi:hypothetical protein
VLLGVPWCRVCGSGLVGELLLGEAHTGLGAVVRAHGSFAGDSLVILEASARASLGIARSLIGALRNGVRIVSGDDSSKAGVCFTEEKLANEAGATYTTPWDAKKHVGCVCDLGRRGPDCSLIECPSGADVLKGKGNESGRDCSGRGLCDYNSGTCSCFQGYYGTKCEYQTVLG